MANNSDLVVKITVQNEEYKRKINELRGQLKSARTEANKKIPFNFSNTSVGQGISLLKGFAGAFLASEAAGKIFNSMLKNSQEIGDAYERVQQQLNSVMDYFASSLASCDFSNFLTGLKNIINASGEAADALDRLDTHTMKYNVTIAKLNYQYRQAMVQASNKNLTKGQREYYQKLAETLNAQIKNQKASFGNEQISTGLTQMRNAVFTSRSKTGFNSGRQLTSQSLYWLSNPNNQNEVDRLAAVGNRVYRNYQYAKTPISQRYNPATGQVDVIVKQITKQQAKDVKAYKDAMRKRSGEIYKALIASQYINTQDKEGSNLRKGTDLVSQGYATLEGSFANDIRLNRTKYALDKQTETKTGTKTGTGIKKTKSFEEQYIELRTKLKLILPPENQIKFTEEEFTKELNHNFHPSVIADLNLNDQKAILSGNNDESQKIEMQKSYYNNLDIIKKKEEERTERQNKYINKLKETGDALSSIGTIADGVGSIFSSLGDSIGSSIANSLSILTNAAVQIIGIYQAQAMAKGIASASGLVFPFNLAAIATVVTTIASLFSTWTKFANGGIVGGSSISGDNIYARLNSGEMVLNSSQQNSLWRTINAGNTGSSSIQNIRFVIRGKDLVGVASNYNSIKSKLGTKTVIVQ